MLIVVKSKSFLGALLTAFCFVWGGEAFAKTLNVTVNISPASAVSAGAQWRVKTGAWYNSGETESVTLSSFIFSGSVTFSDLGEWWVTPASQLIVSTNLSNSTKTLTAAYVPKGKVHVVVQPPDAVAAGAKWKLDDGAWLSSGDTVDVTGENHTVVGLGIVDWLAPVVAANIRTGGETAEITLTYRRSYFTGGVTVTMPPAAATAGAQWSMDGVAWHNSGDTLGDLAPGMYPLQLKTPPGWTPPAAPVAQVIGDQVNTVDLQFAGPTTYIVGLIPPLTARQGETFAMCVALPAEMPGGTLSMMPCAGAQFTPNTGLFLYTPTTDDRVPFALTFQASQGGVNVVQDVVMTPVGHFLPEQDIIEYERNPPNEESADYTSISETETQSDESLNGLPAVKLRKVTITGKTVRIEEGTPSYAAYNDEPNIKEFNVYAEKVIIGSQLHLPQTAVDIHARELRFEDKDSAKPAYIETTPLKIEGEAPGPQSEGASVPVGAPGLTAGSITLAIERLTVSGSAKRFILTGGEGQDAGAGWPGDKGDDCPEYSSLFYGEVELSGSLGAGHVVYLELIDGQSCDSHGKMSIFGKKEMPTDGHPGTPAAKPGNGGCGGTIYAPLDILSYITIGGGAAGQKGSNATGGVHGEPSPAYYARGYFNCTPNYLYNVGELEAVSVHDGAAAAAPGPEIPIGAPGTLQVVPGSQSWFHPYIVRPALQYIRDAYLNGKLDFAQQQLVEYIGLFDAYQGTLPADQQEELAQMRTEMENLLHRIGNNLDYFGNPAGWTPMLSFEALLTAYQQEIDSGMRVMYLSYWLGKKAAKRELTIASMETARDKFKDEVADFIKQYDVAQALIPDLVVESANIESDISGMQTYLEDKETELEQRAQNNVNESHKVPAWKKALRVAGTICKVIPVYQPALAAVGTAMTYVANTGTSAPIGDVISQGTSLVNAFKATDFAGESDKIGTFLDGLKPGNINTPEAARAAFDQIKTGAANVAQKLGPIKDVLKDNQAPQSEVEAELLKLRASDPTFLKITDDLRQLNTKKEVFARNLAEATQAVTRLSAGIAQDLLALDKVSRVLSTQINALDHTAILYIKEMGARARERLLYYQYLVAKAYEYRMLKPYPGTFGLEKLLEKFVTLIEADTGQELGEGDYLLLKGIYEGELRDLVKSVITELTENAPEQSIPTSFYLKQDELDALNKTGEVALNLRQRGGVFSIEHENLRIKSLKVRSIDSDYTRDNIDLSLYHGGDSRLETKGNVYHFVHYTRPTSSPISWSAHYNSVTGPPTNSDISPDASSLLMVLLDKPSTENLLLFSRPAGWADLILRRTGSAASIKDLWFDVEYTYNIKPPQSATLEVQTPPNTMPMILLSQSDDSDMHRQDGVGGFLRAFKRDAIVTLTAESAYGTWQFDHWADGAYGSGKSSPVLSTNPVYSMTMSGNKLLQAVYVNTATVQVPDIVGKTQSAADTALVGAGLTTGTVTQQCSTTVAAGLVISQNPAAGQQATLGSAVGLVVSAGVCNVTVPSVVGLSQSAADTALLGVNLTTGAVTQQCSNTVTGGLVISQIPVAGQQTTSGSGVALVVSNGLCDATVPNLVGLTQSAAGTSLRGANLTAGMVTPQCSNTVTSGLIISQTPAAGQQTTSDSAVAFVVSTGLCNVVVPNVAGQTQSAAGTTLAGANLATGAVTQQCSNTVAAGLVVSQVPASGEQAIFGSPVALVLSTGLCNVVVPNAVGQTQTIAGATLTGANLTTGTVTQQCSNTVAAGVVVSQIPASGQSAIFGSAVALVVSSGLCNVVVPNVVGQTQSVAGITLTGANLTTGLVTPQCSNTTAVGLVISQTPAAGQPATSGSNVALVVSTGLCNAIVPDVVGQSQSAADATLVGANLTAGTIKQQCSNAVAVGLVISQDPVAGQRTTSGSTVALVISTGACGAEGEVQGEGEPSAEGEGENSPPTETELRELLATKFSVMDSNGDNVVSYAEALAALPGLALQVFDALDSDGNGQISRAEAGVDQSTDCRGCTDSKGSVNLDKVKKGFGDLFLMGLSISSLLLLSRMRK